MEVNNTSSFVTQIYRNVNKYYIFLSLIILQNEYQVVKIRLLHKNIFFAK